MHKYLLFAGLMLTVSASHAEVRGKDVSYRASDGTRLKGYIAYDDSVQGKRPGILVVHEWWGLNDYARKRARMFAGQGYTALALDMYGNGRQAANPDEAKKLSGEMYSNEKLARMRFDAARDYLEKQKTVDDANIAAVGYCFGGSMVLNMARVGEPLKAVLSFHGGLGTQHPAEAGTVKARIASFTGEDDPVVPAQAVAAFRQEMDHAGVTYKVVTYPGARHAFTNPAADKYGQEFKLPLAYDEAADKDSWKQGLAFLADAFKKQ